MPRLLAIPVSIGWIVVALTAGCGGGSSGPGQPNISGAPPAGTAGVAYPSFAFTVTSGGVAPYTWTESGPLPPGLALASNGQLSGTPNTAGKYPFTVIVADASAPAHISTLAVEVDIADTPINVAPAGPLSGTTSYPYPGFVFAVVGGGSPPFTWAITAGAAPPGLTLGADGVLSGTPTAAGSFAFTVTATDTAQTPETGSTQVTAVISNPLPPAVNTTPAPPDATNGLAYAYQFSATGGYLPLSWAITAGAPPTGLGLSSAGLLSGTPSAIGSFTFTVSVTDSAPTRGMNSAAFTVTVTNPPPPVINSAVVRTGTVGVLYPAVQFSASGGLAPLVWSESGPLPGLGLSTGGLLSGTPTSAGIFPITVNVTDSLSRSAPGSAVTVRVSLARPAASFTSTGAMTVPRVGHTATLLNTGKVLVAGGLTQTAEIYDPALAMFIATGAMSEVRSNHTATLLNDSALANYGKVLIVGPSDATAELYDPGAGTFAPTGPMTMARDHPTASLLNTGKVLVAGGNAVAGVLTAELYDPASGTFAATGSLSALRVGQTSTLLLDGRVLIAGGGTATAELYDPVSGTFTATGSMAISRSGHTATRLQDGSVLIAGPGTAAELYAPGTGTFSLVDTLPYPPGGLSASLRADGTVLVAGFAQLGRYFGGVSFRGCSVVYLSTSLHATELFAPESAGFTPTGPLLSARGSHTATVLPDGSVLIAGGVQVTVAGSSRTCTQHRVSTTLASAELFK
jgi:hypothetical protein